MQQFAFMNIAGNSPCSKHFFRPYGLTTRLPFNVNDQVSLRITGYGLQMRVNLTLSIPKTQQTTGRLQLVQIMATLPPQLTTRKGIWSLAFTMEKNTSLCTSDVKEIPSYQHVLHMKDAVNGSASQTLSIGKVYDDDSNLWNYYEDDDVIVKVASGVIALAYQRYDGDPIDPYPIEVVPELTLTGSMVGGYIGDGLSYVATNLISKIAATTLTSGGGSFLLDRSRIIQNGFELMIAAPFIRFRKRRGVLEEEES